MHRPRPGACTLPSVLLALALPALPCGSLRAQQLPLAFEPNRGQFDDAARFVLRANHDVWLTDRALVLGLPMGDRLRRVDIELVGGDLGHAEAEELQGGTSRYYLGGTPDQWILDVPRYRRLRCRQVYAGIDLMLYGNGRDVEFDFDLAPIPARSGCDTRAPTP